MDIQQIFTGQKAELRAAEQVQAEQNLLAVLKAKGTREASIQIANMEKDIQMSIAQGNLDQAKENTKSASSLDARDRSSRDRQGCASCQSRQGKNYCH